METHDSAHVTTYNLDGITDKAITHDNTGNSAPGTDYHINVTDGPDRSSQASDSTKDNAISHGITDKEITHDATGNNTLGTDNDINVTDCPDISSQLSDGITDNAISHSITYDDTHAPACYHNPNTAITDNLSYRDARVITETHNSVHVITVITDNPGDITDKTVTHDDTGNDTLGTDYDIHVTDCMPSHLSDGITDNAISHGITDKAISHDDTGNGTLGTDDDINATDCPDMPSRLADGTTDNAIPHGITGDGTHTPDYHHNPDFTITDNPNYRDAGVITETPDSGHVITVITHNPADITDKTITLTHDVTGNSTLGTDSSISDDALPLGTEGDGTHTTDHNYSPN